MLQVLEKACQTPKTFSFLNKCLLDDKFSSISTEEEGGEKWE